MHVGDKGAGPRAASSAATLADDRVLAENGFRLLTPREREVLGLVADGKTSKEIAVQFGLSPRTIDAHRAHIMIKMRTTRSTKLVRLAVLYGPGVVRA